MKDDTEKKEKRIRSKVQNNSIHKWLDDNAKLMKKEGITIKQLIQIILTTSFEMYPTKDNLKEIIWRPIQIAMFSKVSTTELNTDEIDPILEVFIKNVGQATGHEFTPFPSIEAQIQKQVDAEADREFKKNK